jgi:hypothetical protein
MANIYCWCRQLEKNLHRKGKRSEVKHKQATCRPQYTVCSTPRLIVVQYILIHSYIAHIHGWINAQCSLLILVIGLQRRHPIASFPAPCAP